jgi:hypothetical protein
MSVSTGGGTFKIFSPGPCGWEQLAVLLGRAGRLARADRALTARSALGAAVAGRPYPAGAIEQALCAVARHCFGISALAAADPAGMLDVWQVANAASSACLAVQFEAAAGVVASERSKA